MKVMFRNAIDGFDHFLEEGALKALAWWGQEPRARCVRIVFTLVSSALTASGCMGSKKIWIIGKRVISKTFKVGLEEQSLHIRLS